MSEFGTLILFAHGTGTGPGTGTDSGTGSGIAPAYDLTGDPDFDGDAESHQAHSVADALNEAKISPDVIYTSTAAASCRIADTVMGALRVLPRQTSTDSRLDASPGDTADAREVIREFYTDEIVFGLLRRETIMIIAGAAIIDTARIVLDVESDGATLSTYAYDRQLRPLATRL